MTDKHGRRAGYQSDTSDPFDEIPSGLYTAHEDDEINWLKNGAELMIVGAESGPYTLTVIPKAEGAYWVMGGGLISFFHEGEAIPGIENSIQFVVPDVTVAIPSSTSMRVGFVTSPPDVRVGQYVMFVFSLDEISNWPTADPEATPPSDATLIPNIDWNFGDGSPPANEFFPVHVYSTAGVYTVTRSMTDISGTDAAFTEIITVRE